MPSCLNRRFLGEEKIRKSVELAEGISEGRLMHVEDSVINQSRITTNR